MKSDTGSGSHFFTESGKFVQTTCIFLFGAGYLSHCVCQAATPAPRRGSEEFANSARGAGGCRCQQSGPAETKTAGKLDSG